MDRESVERLRYDRRLQRRRDWVDDAQRQAQLDSLPDVSHKMTRGLEDRQKTEADPAKAAALAPTEELRVPAAATETG